MRTPARFALLALLTLPAAGCDLLDGEELPPATTGVYVASQGNFTDANGSITVYDPASGARSEVGGLGSIVQSLLLHEGRGYLLSNTAGRVDVIDLASSARVGQIDSVHSPRYMAARGGRGYVTNLYTTGFSGGTVTVLDLAAGRRVKTIDVGDNPEGLALVGDRLYVADAGFGAGRTLSVIDTRTEEVVDTIEPGCDGPRTLLVDAEEELWVFCTGQILFDEEFNVIGQTDGRVVVLRGADGAPVTSIPVSGLLGAAEFGQDASFSPGSREIHAVKDHAILRFDTRTNTLAETIVVPGDDRIGAVAYDARSERLYLGRFAPGAAGFTTAGFVSIHDRSGAPLASFPAGIAPAYIALR